MPDTPSRYDNLSPRALWFLENFDELDLAEICATQETSSETQRLARIAQAHVKHVDEHGGSTGDCTECGERWPCPTYTWATTARDPLATWDPADDGPQYAPCPAGLLSLDPNVPDERCIVEGPHQGHVSRTGKRWTNPDDGGEA